MDWDRGNGIFTAAQTISQSTGAWLQLTKYHSDDDIQHEPAEPGSMLNVDKVEHRVKSL